MFARFYRDTKKYFRYSIVSAKAQLKAEVANSYLNWVWWILDPLCFMLIYAFVFGVVFDAREQYFPVFIFIGITMWNFFNKTLKSSVRIVKTNKSVVSRVYFPKYILLFTKIWTNGFKMLVSMGIVVLIMLFYQIPLSWNVFFLFPILLTLLLFTFGCSCFLMHYGVYVEDLSHVLDIVLRFFLYATGIFYNLETRIPEAGALLNQVNPVAFMISSMRKALIYQQTPRVDLLLVWLTVSFLLAVLGIRKIYKEENSYVKAI